MASDLLEPGHHIVPPPIVVIGPRDLSSVNAEVLAQLTELDRVTDVRTLHADQDGYFSSRHLGDLADDLLALIKIQHRKVAAGTTCQKEGIAGMRTALQYPAHVIGGGFQIERAILPEDRREWHYHSPPPPLGIAWCDHRPPSFTRHDLHRDHAPLPVRPTRSRGRCALPI